MAAAKRKAKASGSTAKRKTARVQPSARSTPGLRMSDDAVKKATGRTWAEWADVLDGRGAAGLAHGPIAELVAAYGVSGWWSQMVTVGYEQMRGMRVEHETTRGFSVSASKTVPVSAAAAFRLWNDPKQRARWLPGARLTIRKATPAKSLRITWDADGTNVDVGITAKGARKSQISVEHAKLTDATAAERMQAFWRDRLAALAASL